MDGLSSPERDPDAKISFDVRECGTALRSMWISPKAIERENSKALLDSESVAI